MIGSIVILIILISSSPGAWCACPSVSSSVSFISILQFSECRFSASIGRFIPGYFIVFDVTVNGTVY